jgi:hypothetical protein
VRRFMHTLGLAYKVSSGPAQKEFSEDKVADCQRNLREKICWTAAAAAAESVHPNRGAATGRKE